jgi:hypothetical protein
MTGDAVGPTAQRYRQKDRQKHQQQFVMEQPNHQPQNGDAGDPDDRVPD